MSQLKAQIVSNSNMDSWARKIDWGSYILLGRAEDTKRTR